ncbi:hypothetical protein GDO78_014678 [Eleutherodactylus coqui]|uniref:Uncharacterized protein n=1 Tax=Eleutherodactylus coqui TaxID=57060 RepID=A0A8J6EED8_ELECQ|nr:hypothetical protein GDO78_014678 [Eleutherodactylus coqui]
MADYEDTDILHLGLLVLALIAFIIGLLIYSFFIGVNVTDWWKGRSVTPVDHIVTLLGISRTCSQCTKAIYLIISNFHTRLFLYLRGMIVHRTVYFTIATVLLSSFICVISLTLALSDMHRDGIYNTIMNNQSMHCTSINYIYIFTVGAIIPLLFYTISSVLLFSSLYNHIRKMTYYSLMKFVSLTFIYNTLYFIGHFVCVLYYYFYCLRLIWLLIVLDVLPVLHSSYLIYRTPRLRSQMSKVLQYLSDFVSQRKVT